MNTLNYKRLSQNKQRGVSLIELMVALVIVSFLIVAMVVIFLSGRASFLGQEQLGRLQENGRYAFNLMTKEIQRAGYRTVVWEPPRLGFAFTNNSVNGTGSGSDVIELQYEFDKDCFGAYNTATVPVTLPDGTIVNVPRFDQRLISFGVVNNQLIYNCSYGPVNGALAVQINSAVADGVENLQIQYGEDLTNDLSVNRWVNAGGWNNLFDVVAVRIAMAVRTPEQIRLDADTRTLDLYGLTTAAAGDQRIRRVYSGQVSIRNLTL
ncbi:MAG: PilW family protein [Lysobacterales bacterium]